MSKQKDNDIQERIKKSLETVRPSLQADGGDIEFLGFDEKTGIAKVRMLGMCAGCPMMQMTLKEGVEALVKKEVPEVKEVVNE